MDRFNPIGFFIGRVLGFPLSIVAYFYNEAFNIFEAIIEGFMEYESTKKALNSGIFATVLGMGTLVSAILGLLWVVVSMAQFYNLHFGR